MSVQATKRMYQDQLVASGLLRIDTFEDTTPLRLGQEFRVLGSADEVDGVYNLPPAGSRLGDTIYIEATTIANAGTITVKDAAGNGGAAGTELSEAVVLDTSLDYAIVWSDGVVWHVLASEMA